VKLEFIEICGFRGFRNHVRIEFGAGFTVIAGRNGVGKSTVFDAVEFAITGGIAKYSVEKAAKESLSDYLWWRGDGVPEAHFVALSFVDDEGVRFRIRRTRESGSDTSEQQIVSMLCVGTAPELALTQLCRTSIIRDEWIAALSLDLTETERFDLVRSSLGGQEGLDFSSRAQRIASSVGEAHSRSEAEYSSSRLALSREVAALSEAMDVASRAGDVSSAMRLIAEVAGEGDGGQVDIEMARAALVSRRAQISDFARAMALVQEASDLKKKISSFDEMRRRAEAEAMLVAAIGAMSSAERALEEAKGRYLVEEKANVQASSLAVLIDHGASLGLHDGACPLCAAPRSEDEFEDGIELARERLRKASDEVALARENLKQADEANKAAHREYARADEQWNEINELSSRFRTKEQESVDLLIRLNLDPALSDKPDALEGQFQIARELIIQLERAILTLEASLAVSRISELQARVEIARSALDLAAERLSRSQGALSKAREIERQAKRINGEIVDERLAAISPLLNELYQRLRPHADWRTIEYSIRGDVRRFLSLKVGEGLNPQFVFSSGQRRAAGLAFLLSVYIARSWARWKTLLLDDPVQHIDDFRALNLVEVLGALRLEGRQIVCAVEDTALADLMCRRLLSNTEQQGRRYDLDLGPDGATVVASTSDISPAPMGLLRVASDSQLSA